MADGDRWRPSVPQPVSHDDQLSAALRPLAAQLGKLTSENYDRILPRMEALRCADGLCEAFVIRAIALIFSKACMEPKFADLHACACYDLARAWDAHRPGDVDRAVAAEMDRLLLAAASVGAEAEERLPRVQGVTKFAVELCRCFPLYPVLHAHLMSFFINHRLHLPAAHAFVTAATPLLVAPPPAAGAAAFRPTVAQRREFAKSCREALLIPRPHDRPPLGRTAFALMDAHEGWAHNGTALTFRQRREFRKMQAFVRVIARAVRAHTQESAEGAAPRLVRLPMDLVALICTHLAPDAVGFNADMRHQITQEASLRP